MNRYNMASLIVDENNDLSLGYIVDYMSFSWICKVIDLKKMVKINPLYTYSTYV
jgi:hypothetical protein